MNEEWKPVKDYEGLYEVSNLGRVRSLNWCRTGTTKVLVPGCHSAGYKQIQLHKDGNMRTRCVHRLVAEAFIPNPAKLPQVNHKDLNKANNSVENLEWCTAKENSAHYYRTVAVIPERNCKTRKSLTGRSVKSIAQYDLNWNFIKVWENGLAIYREHGYVTSSIHECCEGKRHKAYGYKWQYAIEDNSDIEAAI